MKTLYICLAIFGICLALFLDFSRPNFLDHSELNRPRGLSSWLSYKVEFHPGHGTKEGRFTATLTNVSPYYLSLQLNDKKFHGYLTLNQGTEKEDVILDRHLLSLFRTSAWSLPMTYLAPSKSIIWTMPLSTLVNFDDEPVTKESLAGSMVSSLMEITIVPMQMPMNGYTSGNASQQSAPIQIPVLGNAAPSAAP